MDRDNLVASRPKGFKLPSLTDLEAAVKSAITGCKEMMHTTVTFEDELKKGKETAESGDDAGDDEATEDSPEQ